MHDKYSSPTILAVLLLASACDGTGASSSTASTGQGPADAAVATDAADNPLLDPPKFSIVAMATSATSGAILYVDSPAGRGNWPLRDLLQVFDASGKPAGKPLEITPAGETNLVNIQYKMATDGHRVILCWASDALLKCKVARDGQVFEPKPFPLAGYPLGLSFASGTWVLTYGTDDRKLVFQRLDEDGIPIRDPKIWLKDPLNGSLFPAPIFSSIEDGFALLIGRPATLYRLNPDLEIRGDPVEIQPWLWYHGDIASFGNRLVVSSAWPYEGVLRDIEGGKILKAQSFAGGGKAGAPIPLTSAGAWGIAAVPGEDPFRLIPDGVVSPNGELALKRLKEIKKTFRIFSLMAIGPRVFVIAGRPEAGDPGNENAPQLIPLLR